MPPQITKADITAALSAGGAVSSDYDLNPGVQPPQGKLRDAAVLLTFVETGTGPHIAFTKRALHLQHHPGQVSFPGGKVDAGDASITAAALREGWEETALPQTGVDVLGTLPTHQTVTHFQVTPVVGWVSGGLWDVQIDRGEVAEFFTAPAAHVLNPRNFRVEQRLWQGQQRRYYVVPFGPYYIWGATARILRGLAGQLV